MIQIVDNTNPDQFPDLLEAMFADRKRVFIDQLGWDLPVTAAEFEIDQFDDIHAVYIIAVDSVGGHLGSLRLLRTDKPHILGSLFTQLCDGDVPRGPQMRENHATLYLTICAPPPSPPNPQQVDFGDGRLCSFGGHLVINRGRDRAVSGADTQHGLGLCPARRAYDIMWLRA